MISKSLCDSVGGGVVADIFRDLQKPMRFSGGGEVVAEIFPQSLRDWVGGGNSAEFFFSVTSKRHFPLMEPFYFPEGGPGPPGPPLNRPLECKPGLMLRTGASCGGVCGA